MRLALKKILHRQTHQEPAGAALVVSVSGVGAATVSIREAQLMAASMGEQVEEGASGAPMAGMTRPVVSSMSQAEVA